jgi:hypothetical protein
MSSKRFDAHLDTSHRGPRRPFKDAGVVADSLTGIHSAMVKCLFVVNRSYTHEDFQVFLPVKDPEDSNLTSVEDMQWSSSAYLSVMIGVTENISHITAKMCRSMHRYNSQIKCFRTYHVCWYVYFLLFWYAELVPKVCPHLLITFYVYINFSKSLKVKTKLHMSLQPECTKNKEQIINFVFLWCAQSPSKRWKNPFRVKRAKCLYLFSLILFPIHDKEQSEL